MYVPENRMPNDMSKKLIELQGEIDESFIIVEDFKTSQKWTAPAGGKSVRTSLDSITPSINCVYSVSIDYFIQKQQNIHYSQFAWTIQQDQHSGP